MERPPQREKAFTVMDRTDDVLNRVARLVERALSRQSPDNPVGPDDDLRARGLSSLGLVSLMLSVEAEFDLKIPEREMTPANFRSIARIADLVQALSPRLAASA
jgi:acyl carrier protein